MRVHVDYFMYNCDATAIYYNEGYLLHVMRICAIFIERKMHMMEMLLIAL